MTQRVAQCASKAAIGDDADGLGHSNCRSGQGDCLADCGCDHRLVVKAGAVIS
jgi:hypothetical protein